MPPIDQPRSYARGRARAKRKPVYGPPAPKRKPVYGPPAPKKVYGPPAPKKYGPPAPKPKKVYGPPAPKPKKKAVYGPPAPKAKDKKKTVVYGPPAPKKKAVYGPPAPPKTKARSGPFTDKPLRGMLDAEQRAIRALADLRAQDPEKYDRALEKGGLKDRAIAGPRGQTIEHYKGRSTEEVFDDFSRPAPRKHDILVAGPRGQTRPTRQSGITGGEMLKTAARNAPKDAGELLVTTPSTGVHLAVTAATHPEKLPKELAEPYIKLIKDPVGEFTKHPVSTALMVAPTVKVPARVAGRVAAATGKSSLARPAATLEGTSLRAQRWQSPDLIERGTAKARVPKARRPKGHKVSEKEVDRRVDEAHDAGQLHKQAVVRAAAKQANRRFGKLPKAQRDAAIEGHMTGARGGAAQEVVRRFAREFGSHWYVDAKTGALIKPKHPPENSGVVHASKADAERIAERVPFDAKVMEVEHPDGYAVVPARAYERWKHHGRVGVSPESEAVILRTGTRQFRKTVLPMSTKWLGGQVVEAGLRSAVMGAGPLSYIRAKRLLNAMPKKERNELRDRTVQGGQFGATGPAKEFARGNEPTLAEEFAPTGLAGAGEMATRIGAKPGIRHLRKGYRRYSEVVFNDINGTVERLAKTAMLGKAVKQSPLMEKSLLGLSHKAVEEAAAGLRNTSTMAELGRALDRSYGKYARYGPHARRTLMHTSPFFPWFRNMAEFLLRVMPQDHPVLTALAADVSLAEEEWRKAHGLSFHGKTHVPPFMMGSHPTKDGKYVQFARFGPFMPADAVGELGGQLYPAFRDMLEAVSGRDWTGGKLEGSAGTQAGRIANAALTGVETFVPGTAQVDRISGLGDHYVRGKKKKESVAQGKDVSQAVLDLLNPVKPIGSIDRKKSKAKKKAKKPAGGGYSGFGDDSGGSSSSGGSSGYAGF